MNRNGFASIALIALLPVLLAAVAVAMATYFLLKDDGVARHKCRIELLRAQSSVANSLNELIKLNPKARALRIRRKLAEGKATTPAGLAILTQIIAEQALLAARQNALIAQARAISKSAPAVALKSVDASLRFTDGGRANFRFRGETQPAHFEVIPTPSGKLAPDYNPSPRFRERQEMRVEWKFNLALRLPEWLVPLAKAFNLTAKAECSATIDKGTKLWEPKLTTDKSSSKSSSAFSPSRSLLL